MIKLLLVTCRNIDKNGGENALIMGRHIALFKVFGITTDILFYHKATKTLSNVDYPGVTFLNCPLEELYRKMNELLSQEIYKGVVVSGFYDRKFNEFIELWKKKKDIKYIVDIHATIREIYEYCIPDLYHIVGTRYLYLKKKKLFLDTMCIADYAFVVSDEEIKEVQSYRKNLNIKYIKIVCGCYYPFDCEKYLNNRKKYREQFGILEDELVFVYSGNKAGWQKYEETVRLFEQITVIDNKCKFAFYMDLNEQDKAELISRLGEDKVSIRWVSPDRMKEEITAYDAGALIRDNKWTNRVAFPNKFSDYIAGGLNLIMSEAVVEPYKIALEYGLELFDINNLEKSISALRLNRTQGLQSYISKCQRIINDALLYDVQVRTRGYRLYEDLNRK